jgi:flagellar assembly protein FliH
MEAGDEIETDEAETDEVEVLDYPACPGATVAEWNGWAEADGSGAAFSGRSRAGSERGNSAGPASRESETEAGRRSFESGRAKGREEGRQAEREAQAAALNAEAERQKRQLGALVARFGQESDLYLRAVEQEVVRLSLAVASRILRREAQMDPLLLTGAVRVALGQLAASSEVRLLVPAAELELWQEAIEHLPHLTMKPQVTAGEGMRLGDCRIESRVGTVDLGVRAQLAEIERGFFDRAGAESVGTKTAHGESEAPNAPEAGA